MFNFFSAWAVFRRQNLTSKDGPRAERVNELGLSKNFYWLTRIINHCSTSTFKTTGSAPARGWDPGFLSAANTQFPVFCPGDHVADISRTTALSRVRKQRDGERHVIF